MQKEYQLYRNGYFFILRSMGITIYFLHEMKKLNL